MRSIVAVGLASFTFLAVAPLLWMLISSVMQQQALTSTPPDFSAGSFTLDNYVKVFSSAAALGRGFLNSFIVALSTTAAALAIGAPAAYALARLSVPGANPILMMILATQMFPGIVIAIPLFIAMSRLGLIDTQLALIIVYLSFNLPIVVWILRGFFLAIPAGLERAAAVDGATMVQVFSLIVLPISIAPLFATAVFAFIESWNEFFFALILTRQSAQTAPLVISQFAGQYQTVFGQMMAAATLAVAPVVALAVVFRNRIMRGFAEGMVKG
ncbi:MAG TPA: carbohydrate ABC transporter permease [Methylomirabilota bacterium]|nr:carbohydrate ABC transporter permease [Methylomirabilota bacterium]